MSRYDPHRHQFAGRMMHHESTLDPKAAKSMEKQTPMLLCPRCGQPGAFNPGERCPYCGYYLRCIGCGD